MYRRLKRKITNRFLKDLYGIKCKEIEEVYLASKKSYRLLNRFIIIKGCCGMKPLMYMM